MINPQSDGIKLPYLIIHGKTYNLSRLIDQELTDLRTRIQLNRAKIKDGIKRASAKAKRTGVYTDPDKFADMNLLSELRKQQMQCVQDELHARGKVNRKKQQETFGYYFIEAARSLLGEDGFNVIKAAAKAMAEASQQEEVR
jgi:hypothetical protein